MADLKKNNMTVNQLLRQVECLKKKVVFGKEAKCGMGGGHQPSIPVQNHLDYSGRALLKLKAIEEGVVTLQNDLCHTTNVSNNDDYNKPLLVEAHKDPNKLQCSIAKKISKEVECIKLQFTDLKIGGVQALSKLEREEKELSTEIERLFGEMLKYQRDHNSTSECKTTADGTFPQSLCSDMWDKKEIYISLHMCKKYSSDKKRLEELQKSFPNKTKEELQALLKIFHDNIKVEMEKKMLIQKWREEKEIQKESSRNSMTAEKIIEERRREKERKKKEKKLALEQKEKRIKVTQWRLEQKEGKKLEKPPKKSKNQAYTEEERKQIACKLQQYALAKARYELVNSKKDDTRNVSINLSKLKERDAAHLRKLKEKKEAKLQEEKRTEETLNRLREQVQVKAVRDVGRLLQPTTSLRLRQQTKEKERENNGRYTINCIDNIPKLRIPGWREDY